MTMARSRVRRAATGSVRASRASSFRPIELRRIGRQRQQGGSVRHAQRLGAVPAGLGDEHAVDVGRKPDSEPDPLYEDRR
jgi:hypothetical protein